GGNRIIALPNLEFAFGDNQSLEVFIGQLNGQVDENPVNNAVTNTFDVDPAISLFPYQESFENGNGGWQLDGTNGNWIRGIPQGAKINTASEGQFAWTLNHYNSNQESFLISPVFDLSALTASELKVDIFRQTEMSWDGVQLQISTDCGEFWQTLGRKDQGANWYNSNANQLPFGEFVREGWSGEIDNDWVTAAYSLADYEGLRQVRFRFVFRSDGSENREGFGIDNFRVLGAAKQNQQISVNALPALTYGDQPRFLNATSSAGLPLSYQSSNPNLAEVVNDSLVIYGVGTTQITISQAGNAQFEAASSIVLNINIAKASLQIRPDTLVRKVGQVNPLVQLSFQGFVNGEGAADLDILPSTQIQADPTSAPGNYTIQISGGEDNHYEYVLSPGIIQVLPQEITEVRLINGDTEEILKLIQDGDQIKLANLAELNLNIQAISNPDQVGSVVFRLFGPLSTTVTENIAPYALFGDLGANDFQGRIWPIGQYTLEVQAFTEKSGNGIPGTLKRVSFELIEEAIPVVSRVSLMDTDTDTELFDLKDGDQLQASIVKDRNLSFLIRTSPRLIGSLDMQLNGPVAHQQLENIWPYSLFGDVPGPDYAGKTLLPGSYQLIIRPYTEKNKEGILGNEQIIHFEVLPEFTDSVAALAIDQILLWDAENDTIIGSIQEGANFRLDDLANRKLSVQVIPVSQQVGSVSLQLSGALNHTQTEGLGPYTLYGDAPGPDLEGQNWPAGSYQIQTQAFEGKKGSGMAGLLTTYQFTLEDASTAISELILLEDADSQIPIATLEDGQIYDLDILQASRLDIMAQLAPNNIASVEFELSGPVQMNRIANAPAPFRLFNNSNAPVWCAGNYVLRIRAFTQADAQGSQVFQKEFSFQILKKPGLDQLHLINAAQDQILIPVNGSVQLDVASQGSEFNFWAASNCAESIRFILRDANGEEVINRLENVRPFCLAGDDGKGDYYSWVPSNGLYSLEILMYSQKREQGIASSPLMIQIEVINASEDKENNLLGGSSQILNQEINVFPNPNPGHQIQVTFAEAFEGASQIVVYDQEGKVMLRKSWVQESKEDRLTLNLPNAPWARGVYILKFHNESVLFTFLYPGFTQHHFSFLIID
ncbi:MAG: MBG domain-containing protein, partial [Bacteroidota bacterium]